MTYEAGKFITVFSDASYCPSTGAAGYGGWVKYGDPVQTFRTGGTLEGCTNSFEAECLAIQCTLGRLRKQPDIDYEDKVMVIQSDCQGALKYIEDNMHTNLQALGLSFIKYKWVKGHQGHQNKRSSVNTFCDKQARRHMNRMRQALGGLTHE